MRESLQFERCAAADGERISQKRLKRDHDGLPPEALMAGIRRQVRGRSAVYAALPDRASHGRRISGASFWNSHAFPARQNRRPGPLEEISAASLICLAFVYPRLTK
jgi:hypothetical protein